MMSFLPHARGPKSQNKNNAASKSSFHIDGGQSWKNHVFWMVLLIDPESIYLGAIPRINSSTGLKRDGGILLREQSSRSLRTLDSILL
jgi:hypothetical protein